MYQDGVDPATCAVAEEECPSGTSDSASSVCTAIHRSTKGNTNSSPPDSPTTRSPAKFKKAKQGELSGEESDMEENAAEHSTQTSLEQFPASSQPVLISLRFITYRYGENAESY